MGSHESTLRLQRARIIDAMVLVIHERGYVGASVSAVSEQANISRRTFYEAFDSLEDCLLAFMAEATRHVAALISRAFAREDSWVDGVRAALASLLTFFDSEPVLARVMLVEVGAAGTSALKHREHHIATLTTLIEDRWGAAQDLGVHPLANPGVMAAVLGALHTHLVTGRAEPLTTLLGPLMGIATAPYLDQPRTAREITRGHAMARELIARRPKQQPQPPSDIEIPNLLRNPRAHRARACLHYITQHPHASNRQVAQAIGITKDNHISTLLTCLHHAGLLTKQPRPPGKPNKWTPTTYGQQVAAALRPTQARGRTSLDATPCPSVNRQTRAPVTSHVKTPGDPSVKS